ncbi:hypothetical protein BU16DRAFT_456684 [Lophium mytilinum]|uniref:Fatty acid desaturase domain-containing protein n=1 Tax=Lophium mytilinum TaxID=390894 RepID=A0A6A6QZW5_9PEZI|nr:hypothetical protein BU16DRAFT_456684 [Lophium mytilinum]
MASELHLDPNLTPQDYLVLRNLTRLEPTANGGPTSQSNGYSNGDANGHAKAPIQRQMNGHANGNGQLNGARAEKDNRPEQYSDEFTIETLQSLSNPSSENFEPTVAVTWDVRYIKAQHPISYQRFLQPYIKWARSVVRVDTDVVMLTHLLLYLTTSIPSACMLYYHFTWIHGVLHWLMQSWYVGTYTLMMHQHIHMRGILAKKYSWIDYVFPYITDPLMGHTWNSYFFHHVKHHHVEGNGPDDLSSTLRYQRDSVPDFLHYVGRFFFFVWLDLPIYFFRKGKNSMACKVLFFELGNYATLFFLARYVNTRATVFVFLLPLLVIRIGLMVGNWGQHALVDDVDPNSDFRSSITLVDVASNRFCYNDGYHTSHHLNPLRHWREHPVSFIKQKETYAKEQALVFTNIDYVMMTIKILQKDYAYLAKCMVPIGDQGTMSLEERAEMLRRKTRKFSEEEIAAKFGKGL